MTETPNVERLLGRVEQAIVNLNSTMERIAEVQAAHGDRIDKLENRHSWLQGAAYVVVAIGAWFASRLQWAL